jgi:hypothetical protein
MTHGVLNMLKDVVLPLISVAFAIGAGWYSLRRIPLPSVDYETGPSIGDAPEFHILTNRVAIDTLGQPNKTAGWLAISAAIFGAMTPLWLLIQRLLG